MYACAYVFVCVSLCHLAVPRTHRNAPSQPVAVAERRIVRVWEIGLLGRIGGNEVVDRPSCSKFNRDLDIFADALIGTIVFRRHDSLRSGLDVLVEQRKALS